MFPLTPSTTLSHACYINIYDVSIPQTMVYYFTLSPQPQETTTVRRGNHRVRYAIYDVPQYTLSQHVLNLGVRYNKHLEYSRVAPPVLHTHRFQTGMARHFIIRFTDLSTLLDFPGVSLNLGQSPDLPDTFKISLNLDTTPHIKILMSVNLFNAENHFFFLMHFFKIFLDQECWFFNNVSCRSIEMYKSKDRVRANLLRYSFLNF